MPMNSRRLAALQALAERGATPGERAAAQHALDAERAKQQRKTEQRRTTSRRTQASNPPYSHSYDEFMRAVLYGTIFDGPKFSQEFECIFDPPPRNHTSAQQPPRSTPPTTEPRVKQLRQLTASDCPDLPVTQVSDDPDVLLVEVATAAQMWSLFETRTPWRLVWEGKVWTAVACGTQHDRSRLRFYIKVNRRSLEAVLVPA